MSIDNVIFRPPIPGSSSASSSKVEGTISVGGQDTLLIADMTSRELLEGILIELKKLNLRQEEAFEQEIFDGDV